MSAFDRRAFEEDGRWLILSYHCPCGAEWSDEWSCGVDDDCPTCGTSCSPQDEEDVTESVR